jgi:Ca2+-binding EF-hand superfamily protein
MKIAFALCALLLAGGLTLKAADADKPKMDPEALFKKLDTNGDGSISKEEYMASPQAKKDATKAGERFAKLDKDGDGKLTLEEFKAGMMGKKKAK